MRAGPRSAIPRTRRKSLRTALIRGSYAACSAAASRRSLSLSKGGVQPRRKMMAKGKILVGTVGQGVMMSVDDGDSWMRASVGQGLHSDCLVRALVSDPRQPQTVYAGTDQGLYRSDD